jgi:hypothetical protein
MQVAALAVAEDRPQAEYPPLARGEKLFAGKFRRGVQLKRGPGAARRDRLGGKTVQMRLIARRDLQRRAFDFRESPIRKIAPYGIAHAPARRQQWPAIGMDGGVPPG